MFLKNGDTTNLSNALKFYTSNKPIILLRRKTGFENKENSIEQDSYLRIDQERKSCFSNGNSCKCVIFEDNNPEKVGVYLITLLFL